MLFRHSKLLTTCLASVLLFAGSLVQAASYPLPGPHSRLIGNLMHFEVPQGKASLEDIASRFQIGLIAMLEANPGVDPFLPRPGRILTIPSMMLLPDVPRQGVVINLAELRLYYFPKGDPVVHVFPIGIGRVGRETPVMTTKVIGKQPDPVWVPTANTRAEYQRNGIELPSFVPAGPDNPLGKYALRLAFKNGDYLIHGTNKDFGIGLRVSAGCIRLRPDDIEYLFDMVPIGTPVRVINEPIKFSMEPGGRRYLEVHQPLSQSEYEFEHGTAKLEIPPAFQDFINRPYTDLDLVERALRQRSGIPQEISGY